jgi:phage-related protein
MVMLIKALKPVKDYIDALPTRQREEAAAILSDLQEHGLDAPWASLRKIEGKLWEIRISQSRFFYVMIDADLMILLHAYKKQGQKAPRREIDTALKRMREFLE